LEYKLKQAEDLIYKMPLWVAKKRLKQFEKYMDEVNKSMDKEVKQTGK